MERIQGINFERISWCCADMGITQDALVSELGISSVTLDRLRADEPSLTYGQLRKVAEFFGRGVLFFLESSPVDETRVHTPQFRTIAGQKPELSIKLKKIIERVERHRALYLDLKEYIEDAEIPKFNPPTIPLNNLPEAALIARQWLGLNSSNTFETYRAALELKGILVFRSNGYNGKWQIPKESPILGFTLYDAECPVIVVRKQSFEQRQSFTLMHELAHVLLHKDSSIDDEYDFHSTQGRESEANAFAGHLLVPDSFLVSIKDAEAPSEVSQYDEWLSAFRKAWGVSTEVILLRLLDARRLSQSSYNAYRQWRSQTSVPENEGGTRQYRHREPLHIFGDKYVKTVFDALGSKRISLSKASNYLDNLKITDLHRLESYYASL